jgi:hypothetical protein
MTISDTTGRAPPIMLYCDTHNCSWYLTSTDLYLEYLITPNFMKWGGQGAPRAVEPMMMMNYMKQK